jgi:hypothetical protein
MNLPLPAIILRNFWLKFFSIAMAAVIWLGIHYGIRHELSISQLNINNITVPVAIVTQPGETRLFKITPPEVVVFAVGDKAALRKGIRVYVDLTRFRPRQSAAEEVHADAPPEINIISILPSTVAVEVSGSGT